MSKLKEEIHARPPADRIDFDYLESLDFLIPIKGRQQRSIESRNRIATEAKLAFMSRSYTDVSTHDVAAAAGVTQGLVNYHFGSKQGLWQAAMDQVFGEFRNQLIGRIRELHRVSELEFVSEVIRKLVDLEFKYPFIIQFMVRGSPSSDDNSKWLFSRHIQPIYQSVTHIFEVARNLAILRPLPLANAYYVLMTSGAIFALEHEISIVAGESVSTEAFREAHIQCLTTMLLENH